MGFSTVLRTFKLLNYFNINTISPIAFTFLHTYSYLSIPFSCSCFMSLGSQHLDDV